MHKVAPTLERAIGVPLVHIADATAERLRADGRTRVGLLGTRFTMEEAFYRERLERMHGLEVLVPEAMERSVIDRVIFEELCQGQIRDESRDDYLGIIGGLAEAGAEAVILGCTEIGMLVGPQHSPIPVYDTAQIHSEKAVDLALSEGMA